MKASDVLAKAADLIEPEGRWTQGYRAQTSEGRITEPGTSEAHCWCIVGAIQEVEESGGHSPYSRPALRFVDCVVGHEPALWNDDPSRTQSEVVTALRSASKLAEERGE